MIERSQLSKEFTEHFGGQIPRLFRAPGRVNLIGEHTDYNGGFVLPMAIERETAVAIAPRTDRIIRAYSINLQETAEFSLDESQPLKKGFWMNYVEGVTRLLETHSVRLTGADLLIYSDVPTGAGLSSSAALEIVVGLSLSEISGHSIDRVTLAKIGQQTEHDYVGAKVGIMDQFVSAHAKANHALLLDCRTLKYENVPLDTKEYAVVICDTNVKHNLATSGYNIRRAECEKAVELLKNYLPNITQLRDVVVEEFSLYGDNLPDIIWRRAKHIITENARTLEAAAALKRSDLKDFGSLMWQSHESLRDDFEISCRELDILVEIAAKTEGVLGARMTGGGFGGSTVNLVSREGLDKFKEKITFEYHQATNITPSILVTEADNGANEITF